MTGRKRLGEVRRSSPDPLDPLDPLHRPAAVHEVDVEVDPALSGPSSGRRRRRLPSVVTGPRLARHGSIGAAALALVGVLFVALAPRQPPPSG